jgi:tetratricopeptide (TPR) repeat protein
MFLAERDGRSWFLVLQGDERLKVGRDLGRPAEIAAWVATWAIGRIEEAKPMAGLCAMELVAIGERAEDASDFESAITSYGQAHEAALSTANAAAAIRAARFSGRVLRKLGQWDEALAGYERARDLALALGRLADGASIAIGLANLRLLKGAIPAAAALYDTAIDEGTQSGNRQAVAQGHFGLMWIHRNAEAWTEAVHAGWRALSQARGLPDEWDVLVALADCFRMLGRSEEARCCNLLTLERSPLAETRHQSAQNLAVIAALKGDEASFDHFSAKVDEADLSTMGKGQILFERGQASLALGRPEGHEVLEAALRYAEESKLGKLVFDIEAALELERPWESLLGPDLVPRDAEEEEIRTQLELLVASGG